MMSTIQWTTCVIKTMWDSQFLFFDIYNKISQSWAAWMTTMNKHQQNSTCNMKMFQWISHNWSTKFPNQNWHSIGLPVALLSLTFLFWFIPKRQCYKKLKEFYHWISNCSSPFQFKDFPLPITKPLPLATFFFAPSSYFLTSCMKHPNSDALLSYLD
jgi:hypothetical protein